MTILQAIKNVKDRVFIQRFERSTQITSRVDRQRKERLERKKQIDDAILSTGIHHRESLFKKWGRN